MAEPQVPALALWALGNFVDTAGIFCLMVGPVLQRPVLIMVADALVALGPGLIWKAARSLDGKPAPWAIAVLGGVVAGLTSASPATRAAIDTLSFASGAAYLFAAAYSLWLSQAERLAARRPLIILTALHAAVLFAGALGYWSGAIVDDTIPTTMSLFGLIDFESMLFLLGTSVFLLAFVKEREETASRIAASTDPLTGIANRGGFTLRGDRVVDRCRRDGSPVSVLMFDLDRFKEINDTFGHAVGDAALLKFCEVASARCVPTTCSAGSAETNLPWCCRARASKPPGCARSASALRSRRSAGSLADWRSIPPSAAASPRARRPT